MRRESSDYQPPNDRLKSIIINFNREINDVFSAILKSAFLYFFPRELSSSQKSIYFYHSTELNLLLTRSSNGGVRESNGWLRSEIGATLRTITRLRTTFPSPFQLKSLEFHLDTSSAKCFVFFGEFFILDTEFHRHVVAWTLSRYHLTHFVPRLLGIAAINSRGNRLTTSGLQFITTSAAWEIHMEKFSHGGVWRRCKSMERIKG